MVASAGDVNGDGYGDLVVGAWQAMPYLGRAYIYFGSATGLSATPSETLVGPDGGQFGGAMVTLGDVNGDGFADLAIGAAQALGGTGRVYVFLGSPHGVSLSPDVVLTGSGGASDQFGYALASGDLNGDGFSDMIAGVGGAGNHVFVYMGGPLGLPSMPDRTLVGPGSGGIGGALSSADVTGDGFADLLVGTSSSNAAYVYAGGSSGVAMTPATTLAGVHAGAFGQEIASAGDVNQDGFPDVAVADYRATDGINRVYIFPGGVDHVGTSPLATLTGPDEALAFFGASMSSADFDDDGYVDFAVSAVYALSNTGRAYVFRSIPAGIGSESGIVITGPDGPGGDFGASLAWMGRRFLPGG